MLRRLTKVVMLAQVIRTWRCSESRSLASSTPNRLKIAMTGWAAGRPRVWHRRARAAWRADGELLQAKRDRVAMMACEVEVGRSGKTWVESNTYTANFRRMS